jgi:AcrR family transcriptional regulator
MAAKAQAPSTQAAPKGVAPARDSSAEVSRRDGAYGLGRVIELQRARILAAMVEAIDEHGAANVTVAHVVERAGVSRRTFYELYRDREDCFLGAFDEAVARASRYVLDDYDPTARWATRVRAALTGLLTFLDLERAAGRLLVVGSLGAGASALERRRRVLAQMIALVAEGQTEAKAATDPPPLTAEGIVGGVLSVLHVRLLDSDAPAALRDSNNGGLAGDSLLALTASLMSMIVLPYFGPAAARRELARPAPMLPDRADQRPADPLRDVHMRLTYRTVRVLAAVAELSGQGAYPSNREVGAVAGMRDQGQISRLLNRLCKLGLIENGPTGRVRGEPNAWMLTTKGQAIERVVREDTGE